MTTPATATPPASDMTAVDGTAHTGMPSFSPRAATPATATSTATNATTTPAQPPAATAGPNPLTLLPPSLQQQLMGVLASVGGTTTGTDGSAVMSPAQLEVLRATLAAMQQGAGLPTAAAPGVIDLNGAPRASEGAAVVKGSPTALAPLAGSVDSYATAMAQSTDGVLTGASAALSPAGATPIFSMAAAPPAHEGNPTLRPLPPAEGYRLLLQHQLQQQYMQLQQQQFQLEQQQYQQQQQLQLQLQQQFQLQYQLQQQQPSQLLPHKPLDGITTASIVSPVAMPVPVSVPLPMAPAVANVTTTALTDCNLQGGGPPLTIEEENVQLRNVYVASLPRTLTQAQLLEMFRAYGRVQSVRLCRGASSNDRSGYGFVLFETREAAIAAVAALQHATIDGRTIQVRLSKMTENTSHLRRHPGRDNLTIEAATVALARRGVRRVATTAAIPQAPQPHATVVASNAMGYPVASGGAVALTAAATGATQIPSYAASGVLAVMGNAAATYAPPPPPPMVPMAMTMSMPQQQPPMYFAAALPQQQPQQLQLPQPGAFVPPLHPPAPDYYQHHHHQQHAVPPAL